MKKKMASIKNDVNKIWQYSEKLKIFIISICFVKIKVWYISLQINQNRYYFFHYTNLLR